MNELPSHPVIPMADVGADVGGGEWLVTISSAVGGIEPLSLGQKENSAQGDWVARSPSSPTVSA